MSRAIESYTFPLLMALTLTACGGGGSEGTADAGGDAGVVIDASPDVDADVDAGSDASTAVCEGAADGTPCGDATTSACDGADTCVAGACVPNHTAADTACGDATETTCDHADTCDGAGVCLTNLAAVDIACGDATETDCDHADSCDGAGACLTNLAAVDAACGDAAEADCDHADTCDGSGACLTNIAAVDAACGDVTEADCDHADTCDGAGVCLTNLEAADTACGDASETECDHADTCDAAGACLTNFVAVNAACGDPGVTECDLADACNGAGACTPSHVAAGGPCGDPRASQCDGADTCNGAGLCGVNITASGTACYDCAGGAGVCDVCDAAACHDAPFCHPDALTLGTGATNNNGNRGAMFDVRADDALTISGFDIVVDGGTIVEVYTKLGSYRSNTPGNFPVNTYPESAWTFLGAVSVTRSLEMLPDFYQSASVILPASVRPSLAAGETRAFYLRVVDGAGLRYQTAVLAEADTVVASDANLAFFAGVGVPDRFGGGVNFPRKLVGTLRYVLPGTDASLATTSLPYVGDVADGAMFDVTAASDTELFDGLEVELVAGTHDVDVYMRRGSFVGAEGTLAGWTRIGGGTGLVSAGGGALTRIALGGPVALSTGEAIGLYIDTRGTGLRTSAGASVGDVATVGTDLTLYVGNAIDAEFGGIGPAATARLRLTYDRCL